MKVSGNGGTFKHPEPGTVNAICTRVIDLGTQETTWQGQKKTARKVLIGWEIDQQMDDQRPFLVTARYTASIHPKSVLGQHLEAWRGRPFSEEELKAFDLNKILGACCLLTIVRDGEYSNVKGVAKLPKGMAPLEPHGPLTLLDLENYSEEVYSSLSEPLRATIAKSPEFQKATGEVADAPEGGAGKLDAEDIPF